jgi:hypothetical protein
VKKEEMITILRSVGCDENTVTAMINAYEMGFDHGAKAYVRLTEVVECAVEVLQQIGVDDLDGAKEASKDFWSAMEGLRAME